MKTAEKIETGAQSNGVVAPVFFVSSITGESFGSRDELEAHYKSFVKLEPNQEVVTLQFQRYLTELPITKENLQKTYSGGDELTIASWIEEWRYNKRENLRNFEMIPASVEHAKCAYKPCIIAGSGPSLRKNAHHLKDRGEIGLVSCLHNFAYFHDMGVKPDYYLNLDAGNITLWEMSQGGSKPEAEYWEASKDYTLLTALHCNPKMHEKWKGKILWFDTALNGMNDGLIEEFPKLKDFRLLFQTGGNTLGACHYMAKAVLGATPIIFVGADFAFGQNRKFHPFDSPYDNKFSGLQTVTDIFGNKAYTWASYYGFKTWFEYQAMGGAAGTPGTYINCTEGGILGAYPQGNIMHIRQRMLIEVLREYTLHKDLPKVLSDKSKYWTLY